jgi:hypothetical protein
MTPVTHVYASRLRNVGDAASTPALYFSLPVPTRRADLLAAPPADPPPRDVIFGGGGQLHCLPDMARWADAATGRLISWGIGHNTHGDGGDAHAPPAYPAGVMDRFALHGVRDWGTPYSWVPCASCMHPAFDARYRVTRPVVVYDHRDFPTGVRGLPSMTNDHMDVEAVIAFLASADAVVTSSYHGAYWATLLGRRVVVVGAFSTKFHHFRYPPRLSTADRWRADLADARRYPQALSECRAANRAHHARVCELVSPPRKI